LANRYDQIRVTGPAGKNQLLERAGQPQLIYTHTDDLGFYLAKPIAGERLLQLFTVNLFSERESDIAVRSEVAIGTATVAAQPNQQDSVRIELWRWLLAVALLVLSAEWYLYTRRIAV
jgi:hypothetical protein